MKVRSTFVRLIAAAFVGCGLSHAATWTEEETGVSFQLPSDASWEKGTARRPEVKLLWRQKDGGASVAFIAFEKKPNHQTLTEEFVQRWEKGYYKKPGGARKVSGEFITFKNIRAYQLVEKETDDGTTHWDTIILWLQGDRLCEIMAMKAGSDPLKEEVIKKFVDSIDFGSKASDKQ